MCKVLTIGPQASILEVGGVATPTFWVGGRGGVTGVVGRGRGAHRKYYYIL